MSNTPIESPQQPICDVSSSSSRPGLHEEKMPVHVLMLEPGSHAFKRQPSTRSNTQPGCDLIEQRWLHRERSRGATGLNTDISFYCSEERGYSGALWIGASPLEIALIDCCTGDEYASDNHEQGDFRNGVAMKRRSRLKRARDDEDDYLPSDEEDDNNNRKVFHETSQNRPKLIRGSLKRGREAQFLSLMVRHCYSLSDRSLALAILSRTVQADKDEEMIHKHKEQLYKQSKQGTFHVDTPVQPAIATSKANIEEIKRNIVSSPGDDKSLIFKEVESEEKVNTYPSPGKLPIPIITTFLTMGGMKVLNQWLQEAFTPTGSPVSRVTDVSSAQRQKTTSTAVTKKRTSSNTSDTSKLSLAASRTRALLPVILKLLQDMPFHKTIVYETQINKQIRKLKKGLDKSLLKFEKEPNRTLNVEYYRDPIYGTLPVVQLQKAVENLMNVWKEAVISSNKSSQSENIKNPNPDSWSDIRQALRERFEATFPHLQFIKLGDPLFTPSKAKLLVKENKVASGKQLSTNTSTDMKKIGSHDEELNSLKARLDAKKKILELYRQKMVETSNMVVATSGKGDMNSNIRRVTWPDISKKGFLVEVREYIVDNYHAEHNQDFSSEIREEQYDFERKRLLQNDRPMTYVEEEDDDDEDIFS